MFESLIWSQDPCISQSVNIFPPRVAARRKASLFLLRGENSGLNNEVPRAGADLIVCLSWTERKQGHLRGSSSWKVCPHGRLWDFLSHRNMVTDVLSLLPLSYSDFLFHFLSVFRENVFFKEIFCLIYIFIFSGIKLSTMLLLFNVCSKYINLFFHCDDYNFYSFFFFLFSI